MGQDRGDIKLLCQYFGAQGITPPDPRPLFSHSGPAHEADEEAGQNDIFRALAGDKLEIRIGAAVEGALECFERIVVGAFAGDAESVGVEDAALFAGQKIRFLRGKFGQCAAQVILLGGPQMADSSSFQLDSSSRGGA